MRDELSNRLVICRHYTDIIQTSSWQTAKISDLLVYSPDAKTNTTSCVTYEEAGSALDLK